MPKCAKKKKKKITRNTERELKNFNSEKCLHDFNISRLQNVERTLSTIEFKILEIQNVLFNREITLSTKNIVSMIFFCLNV